jgi:hypothetical protein
MTEKEEKKQREGASLGIYSSGDWGGFALVTLGYIPIALTGLIA